jgi:hypothetical protein
MKAIVPLYLLAAADWDWRQGFQPSTWATWALVLVGVGAAFAAVRTLKTMQKEISLQEVALQQWVILRNWRARIGGPPERREMTVDFDLVNPTQFTLTFQQLAVEVAGSNIVRVGSHVMAPEIPYPLDFSLPVGYGDEQLFDHASFVIRIKGKVKFTDVRGLSQFHPFGGQLTCGDKHVHFVPSSTHDDAAA